MIGIEWLCLTTQEDNVTDNTIWGVMHRDRKIAYTTGVVSAAIIFCKCLLCQFDVRTKNGMHARQLLSH